MATGDQADQIGRLKRLLPPWFADTNPIRDAVLTGISGTQAFLYSLIQFAKRQTRIKTATGGWLDLIAVDFFGSDARRAPGQSDASFLNTILINLFRERATRAGMSRVLTDLTGYVPSIFEPSRVQDTGAYRAPSIGYGRAGAYGSLLMPFQALINVNRPPGSGIPLVAGYGVSTGGYSRPSRAEYASLSMVIETIRDEDIYSAIDGVKPVATTMWVRIANGNPVAAPPPNFSLLLGIGPIYLGTDTAPIRLLGWQL